MTGDKETFWLGWELVGDMDYAFHQGDAGTMGTVEDAKPSDTKLEEKKEQPPPRQRRKKQKKPTSTPQLDENGEPITTSSNDPDPDHEAGGSPEEEEEEEWEDLPSDPSESDDPIAPTSYTMCSPQLVHLDLDSRPLWFNGWLLTNKFADKKQKKFARFESYLIEPRDVREPGAWQLEESNMCCLTTDNHLKRDFTEDEKEVLNMMVEQAREVVGITG